MAELRGAGMPLCMALIFLLLGAARGSEEKNAEDARCKCICPPYKDKPRKIFTITQKD